MNILPPRVYIRAYLHAYSVIHTCSFARKQFPMFFSCFCSDILSEYQNLDKQLITNNYSKVSRKVNCIYLKTFRLLNNITYRWNLVIIFLFHLQFYLQFDKTLVFDRTTDKPDNVKTLLDRTIFHWKFRVREELLLEVSSPVRDFFRRLTDNEDNTYPRTSSSWTRPAIESHNRKLNGGLKIVRIKST